MCQWIIGSDNGLSPGWRQAIIWTNAGIVLIGTLGTSFIDILSGIHTFSFKKMYLEMSSAKWRPFCLGLNVLEMPHGIVDLCHHWFRWYLGAFLLPSHYLNQCWLIVKWTNILQWNFFYKKIHLQIVCKMLTICSPWTKWPPFWQTTISNVFSWMKIIGFQFEFHRNLSPWLPAWWASGFSGDHQQDHQCLWLLLCYSFILSFIACILLGIKLLLLLLLVPRSPIDNKPALVQVMAWHRTGNKPLSEPVLTQFTDAYMRH